MTGPWSEDELIIAMEFYFECPEKMHTDSHPKCKQIARTLERSPGAVDRIIRNIKYAATGGTGLSNASKRIWDLVEQYKSNVPELKRRAAAVRRKYHWPPLDCGN
jgi:hypothetical protein